MSFETKRRNNRYFHLPSKINLYPGIQLVCDHVWMGANDETPPCSQAAFDLRRHMSKMMHLFFTIPDELQANILCLWLLVETVAVLDSALCSKLVRPSFLDLLENKCVFDLIDATELAPTEWFVTRGLRTTHLIFGYGTRWEVSERWSLFNSSSKTLKVLEIMGPEYEDHQYSWDDSSYLRDIAEECPLIATLLICGDKIDQDFDLVFEKCTLLTSLYLQDCTLTLSSVTTICGASNLEFLKLSDCTFKIGESDSTFKSGTLQKLVLNSASLSRKDLLKFCSCFPRLTDLSIDNMNGVSLCLISEHCPLVRFARIVLRININETHARLICKQWHYIELLQFQVSASEEEVILILLKGCPHLQKLSVCRLDNPYAETRLYPNTKTDRTNIPLFSGASGNNASSKVTDLFLESASAATLSAILTQCPQLDTLAFRHTAPYSPLRTAVSSSELAAEYALSLLNNHTCSVRKLHLHNISTLLPTDLLSVTCLQEIQLSGVGMEIDNQTILRIARTNPNLNSITLYNCVGLCGSALIPPLLKACPKLRILNFQDHNTKLRSRRDVLKPGEVVLFDVVKYCFPNVKVFNLHLK